MTKKTNSLDLASDWLSNKSITIDKVAKIVDLSSYKPHVIGVHPFLIDSEHFLTQARIQPTITLQDS
jgi:hypothetical protein